MNGNSIDARARPSDEAPKLLQFPTEAVHGTVLPGFVQACKNLHIIAPDELEELAGDIEPLGWYPLDRLSQCENVVAAHFQNASVERSGQRPHF